MNTYKKINNYIGWSIFLIASFVYLSTIEQTVSFWDCGEYISTAYKLEVGHPPGAPFFQLFGRIFTLFAAQGTSEVAIAINVLSALCSSFTILFLFWTITAFGRKIYPNNQNNKELGKNIAMHVAAQNPLSLNIDSLDPAALQRERNVLVEQAQASGKPEAAIEKMVGITAKPMARPTTSELR